MNTLEAALLANGFSFECTRGMHLGSEAFWVTSRLRFSDAYQCDAGRRLALGMRAFTSRDRGQFFSAGEWISLETLCAAPIRDPDPNVQDPYDLDATARELFAAMTLFEKIWNDRMQTR